MAQVTQRTECKSMFSSQNFKSDSLLLKIFLVLTEEL